VVIVEDTGRVDGGKEKEAKKEKGKKREEEKGGIGLVIVRGAGRCDACVREDTQSAGDRQVVGGREEQDGVPQESVRDELQEVRERQEEVLHPAGDEGDSGRHSGGAEIVEDFVGDFETGGSAYEGITGA